MLWLPHALPPLEKCAPLECWFVDGGMCSQHRGEGEAVVML